MTSVLNVPQEGSFVDNQHRGIASLAFKGQTLHFRTNPNEVWWSYTLNTNVEQTYGGRVVQIMSVNIGDLVIKIDCGNGGWKYLKKVVDFLRQMMIDQRKGDTATFEYTTRRWKMKVYALTIPFGDQVTATTRELELRFKVQEDVSGVQSQMALSKELQQLKDGIGFKKGPYNTPKGSSDAQGQSPSWVSPADAAGNLLSTVTSFAPGGIGGIGSSLGLPGIGGVF